MKLHWVRNEIALMRGQIRAREREIHMLQWAGVATVSAELLLSDAGQGRRPLPGADALRKAASGHSTEPVDIQPI